MNKQKSTTRINSKSGRSQSVQNKRSIQSRAKSRQKIQSLGNTKSNNIVTASKTQYRAGQQNKMIQQANNVSEKDHNHNSQQKIRAFNIESCTPKRTSDIESKAQPLEQKQKQEQIVQQLTTVYEINKKYLNLLNQMVASGFKVFPQSNQQQFEKFTNIMVSPQKNISSRGSQSKPVKMSQKELVLHGKIINIFQQNLNFKLKLQIQNKLRQQCFKLRQYIKNKVQSQQFQSKQLKEGTSEHITSEWAKIYRQLFLSFMNKEKQLQILNSQVKKYEGLSRELQEYQQKDKQTRRSCSPKQLKQLSKSQYDRLKKLEKKVQKEKKRYLNVTQRNSEMIQQLQQVQKKLNQSQKLKNNIQIKFIDLNRQIQYCRSKSKKYSKIMNEKEKQQIRALNHIASIKKVGTKISN